MLIPSGNNKKSNLKKCLTPACTFETTKYHLSLIKHIFKLIHQYWTGAVCEVKYLKLQMKANFAVTTKKKYQDLDHSRIQPIGQQRKRAAEAVTPCSKSRRHHSCTVATKATLLNVTAVAKSWDDVTQLLLQSCWCLSTACWRALHYNQTGLEFLK